MLPSMLPKFHVRNLRSSSQPSKSRDSLVLISAPTYDTTISDHPAAALKYRDEDGDDITVRTWTLSPSPFITDGHQAWIFS